MVDNQNHALVWMIHLVRLIQFGCAKFDATNPKVLLLNAKGSCFYLCGRDSDKNPYLGVPLDMMPFFTQLDWMDAAIDRNSGYLFLEAKDPRTGMLNIALGFKFRAGRQDVLCLSGKEDPATLRLSIKVFEQDKKNPQNVIFSDQDAMTGIPIREISSTAELGSEADAEYSREVLGRSGVDSTFTVQTVLR